MLETKQRFISQFLSGTSYGNVRWLHERIHTIITTEPYSYKLILDDKDETADRKTAYETELLQYTDYEKQLQQQLDLLTQ